MARELVITPWNAAIEIRYYFDDDDYHCSKGIYAMSNSATPIGARDVVDTATNGCIAKLQLTRSEKAGMFPSYSPFQTSSLSKLGQLKINHVVRSGEKPVAA